MSVYKMGGPNSAIEKSYQLRIANLNRDVEKRSKKISNIINKGLTTTETNIKFWKGLSSELDTEYKALYALYRDWGSTNIPASYRDDLVMINKQIFKMANVTNKAKLSVEQIMSTKVTRQFTRALYEDALLSWGTGLNTGKMNMERLMRMTRQSLIDEALFDTTLAEAIEGGNVRAFSDLLASKNPTYKALLEAAENERFIQAGSRKYKPEYYSEMVSRVKFHEAQSQAAKTQAKNYNTDLVVVSTHNTTTVVCQAFEGKIFSISGKDPRFPKLQETAPYHTNCIHLMFPQFESALIASGTLDQFSAFSKGKVDAPPYPAGFVPIGDRTDE